jgi:hypothetical protein
MEVWFYNDTIDVWVLLDSQNESSACGGSIDYTIPNVTGKYAFKCFYKKTGYDEKELGETGSLIKFFTNLKQGLVSVPDYAWFLITIVIMLVGMGFFAHYFGPGILLGYVGLGIFAIMLMLKDVSINIGGTTTISGWMIWAITFILYTMGVFIWNHI